MKGTPTDKRTPKRLIFAVLALLLLVLSPGFLANIMVQQAQMDRIFGTGTDYFRQFPTRLSSTNTTGVQDISRFGLPVPRVYIDSLPDGLEDMQVKQRKAVFNATMLPLVLKANEDIRIERAEILAMRDKIKLTAEEKSRLVTIARKYRLDLDPTKPDFVRLLRRVDIIPPSLALAQSAIESGWGTSRFAREGNALYGQWVWGSSTGIVPEGRDKGARHSIRAFDSLLDSVRAYMLNLNRHRAYSDFRRAREAARQSLETDGRNISGKRLAGALEAYSTRRGEYVKELRVIIDANRYTGLDQARLEPPWWRQQPVDMATAREGQETQETVALR